MQNSESNDFRLIGMFVKMSGLIESQLFSPVFQRKEFVFLSFSHS